MLTVVVVCHLVIDSCVVVPAMLQTHLTHRMDVMLGAFAVCLHHWHVGVGHAG